MGTEASPTFRPLSWSRLPPEASLARARAFYEAMRTRRSVRAFSPEPLPEGLLDLAIATAGTAPSGANRQPWTFVVVTEPSLKKQIREAAEAEEKAFYEHRATDEWLEALAPLGTDAQKPFLEVAPALIVVFRQDTGVGPRGELIKHYYVQESVGLAVGLLLASLHQAGLATLTHTPSPMAFLAQILGRPANERPFVLIPVGYPAPDAQVPDITRKSLEEIRLRR